MKDHEVVNWMIDRMVQVYGESPNVDFLHKARAVAANIESQAREIERMRSQLTTLTGSPDRAAMAKALCKHHSDQCGVNADDQWKEYSQHFLEEVDVMLAALKAQPSGVVLPERTKVRMPCRMYDEPDAESPEFARGHNTALDYVARLNQPASAGDERASKENIKAILDAIGLYGSVNTWHAELIYNAAIDKPRPPIDERSAVAVCQLMADLHIIPPYTTPQARQMAMMQEKARAALSANHSEQVREVVFSIPKKHDLSGVGGQGADVGYGGNLCVNAINQGAQQFLDWCIERWHAEVSQRPLVNVHRRSIDDTWRQVIRKLGGDPVDLCGPDHSTLLAEVSSTGSQKEQGE